MEESLGRCTTLGTHTPGEVFLVPISDEHILISFVEGT